MTRDDVLELLDRTLEANQLPVDRVGGPKRMTMLEGQWKRTIPVLFHVDERTLKVTTLLSGAPDEGHAEVYAILLHRNERLGPLHFALDDEGDVVLTGALPLAVVDEDALDQLLGLILVTCDEVFNQVLRAGFAGYIEVEQAWRARNDLPANPVSTQG